MAHIKYRDADGQTVALELVGGEVLVGRLPECDIVISKGFVSRRHARVFRRSETWFVADLGSVHGTYVNRLRVEEKELEPGDEIRVGDEVLLFADTEAPAELLKRTIVSGSRPASLETTASQPIRVPRPSPGRRPGEVVAEQPIHAGKLMKASITANKLRELDLSAEPPRGEPEKGADKAGGEERQLLRLVRITDVISRCHDAASVCRTAVALAMRATGADRGVLATREGDSDFVPRVQLRAVSDGAFAAGEVEYSDTFVQEAVRKQVARIARDTADDVDLSSAKSIVAMQIRSILCAPFGDGASVQGWLYLDSVGGGRIFRHDDLDLVSVIGYHASAQLGRLRLADAIRAEQTRRENLARFFSPDVIRHIEEEAEGGRIDPSLSVREQTATVLFADIQGFASISEGMKPPALKRLLDEYFDRMTEILVDRHGGTLDKYIGDAIMALFGAPFSRGVAEDARAAVAAAVEMRDTLERLRKEKPEFRGVHVRIGLNTGRVVAGMMGSRRRLEYSVVGDAVNVASRLESSGEPGKILIGEQTHAAVKDAFECESAGLRQVKNRAQPVPCWWVLGLKLQSR